MKTSQKIIEIETLCENLLKQKITGGLLRFKVLSFIEEYQNLSVGLIIEKLGIKKSNFALLTSQLEKEGKIVINKTETDKRCRTLSLTKSGEEELEDYLNFLETRFLSTSVQVDESIDILLNYLNKIV